MGRLTFSASIVGVLRGRPASNSWSASTGKVRFGIYTTVVACGSARAAIFRSCGKLPAISWPVINCIRRAVNRRVSGIIAAAAAAGRPAGCLGRRQGRAGGGWNSTALRGRSRAGAGRGCAREGDRGQQASEKWVHTTSTGDAQAHDAASSSGLRRRRAQRSAGRRPRCSGALLCAATHGAEMLYSGVCTCIVACRSLARRRIRPSPPPF